MIPESFLPGRIFERALFYAMCHIFEDLPFTGDKKPVVSTLLYHIIQDNITFLIIVGVV